jgi:uncharacterized coiled-coil protein SlyX
MVTAIVILGILVVLLMFATGALFVYVIKKQKDNEKTFDTMSEALVEDWEKMEKYSADYERFEKFPQSLTDRISNIEFRMNKFDDIIRVMNQGFNVPTQSEMHNPYM